MAVYSTNFGEYTTGQVPYDWTPIWVTSNSSWIVRSASDALGGNVLEHTATADARRAITFDWPDIVYGDFDIMVKWRTTDSGLGNIPIRVFVYVSGTATQSTQQGYQLDGLFPSTIRIGRTTNGSYSTLVSNTQIPTMYPNTWYMYRLQKVGDTLQARIWADGASEPNIWHVSVSSTALPDASGKVGLGAYDYNGVRQIDYFSIGTNGDSAKYPDATPPADTTAPAEITNLTEQHTDLAVDFNWTNPTDADFSSVKIYKDGSEITNGISNGRFTDTQVVPNTTYQYRFVTVDVTNNESAGVTISVTTDAEKTYEFLQPIEITAINNLTPNDVTYIQDDPNNEDANVMVPINNLSRPTVRMKFQQPTFPLQGIQTIRWVFDDPNYVGSLIRIWEGSTLVLESPLQYAIGGTEPVVYVFDADDYTFDKTLQTTEVEFVSTLYNGITVNNFGAIKWSNPIDYVTVPINGSITGSSGGSATLNKRFNMSGSLSVASSMEGAATVHRGITGQTDSISTVNGNVTVNRAINGNTNVVSTVNGTITVNRAINGNTEALSSVSAELANNKGITGAITSLSDAMGTLVRDIPIRGDIAAGSTVPAAGMARSYDLRGSVTAQSTTGGNLREVDSFVGIVASQSTAAGTLSINKGIQGQVEADSGTSGTAVLHHSISGTASSVSNVEAALVRAITLQGSIGAESTVDAEGFTVKGQIPLKGTITSLSSTSGSVSVAKPLSGRSEALSSTGVTLALSKPLQGMIEAGSAVAATSTAQKPLEGIIAVRSASSAEMQGMKPLSGSIDAESNVLGDVTTKGQIDLRGSIAAGSTLSATMSGSKPLQGTITSLSSVTGTVVEGTEFTGFIESQSTISADLQTSKPLEGTIDVRSSVSGAFTIEGAIPLSGSIDTRFTLSGVMDRGAALAGTPIYSVSGITASMGVWKALEGNIDVNVSVNGDAINTVPLDAHIFVSSSLTGQIDITADITLNGSTGAASGVSSDLLINRSLIGQAGSETDAAAMMGKQVQITGTIRSISTASGRAGKIIPIRGNILANSILYDQEPIDTLIEINDVLYSGVAVEDDGKALSYTIDSGVGRRIEFVFEFIVERTNLVQLQFKVEGIQGQPFQLQAYDPASQTWDTANVATYDGKTAEQVVTLTIQTPSKYLNSSNQIRLRMLSVNTFKSGTMTLSTDYAELIKTYQVKAG